MSDFNKMIKNISNYNIPIRNDDNFFINESILRDYSPIQFVQGNTRIECRSYRIPQQFYNKHLSNYIWSPDNPLIIPTWACESKEESPLYKYFIIDNWIVPNNRRWNYRFAYTNTLNVAECPCGTFGTWAGRYNENRIILLYCQGYLYFLATYENDNRDIEIEGLGINIEDMIRTLGSVDYSIKSPTFGDASSSGGYVGGTFDDSSDTIDIPQVPSIGVTNVGFINVYRPTLNTLVNFGSELFPLFDNPTYEEDLSDITDVTALEKALAQSNIYQFNILKNLYNSFTNSKLIDFVLDCHCIPVSPSITISENIKVGYKEFDTQSPKVSNDYVDFDCGVLNIEEYYTNFIDYVGTRAKLYLPFIGFVDIQPEYFQSATLQVIYRFNIIDGSFMAYVISSSSKSQLRNSVIASYGGNACVHLPITSANYSTMISSVLNGTAGVISGLTHGNPIGALNSAMNTLTSKPDMQASNGYNATSAYLGIRYPYLIIEREVSNFSEKYTNEYGLPCNITKTINELSGFIQMDNIHLETLTCTDAEKTLIQNLLQNGIIV